MHRKAGRGRRKAPRRKKAPQRSNKTPQRSLAAAIAGGFGELLLTAGALVLLFVVYTLWGTGIQTAAAQDDLRNELTFDVGQVQKDEEQKPAALDELKLGDAYGILRIPRFGDEWEWIVVQGTKPDDLKDGPGHYLDSADPGELGNFSIAGHRSGHGEPFADFAELRVGDTIEIETATGIYTYKLDDAPGGDSDGNKIDINETWVVDPVPGEPADTEPTERRITLTTCWPRWGSTHRMYATGTLVGGGGEAP
ncbi:sortase A [Haloactinopolyspora alba]|uniref:Sortase A n=1 Tax=Haloactinopolyspora alba TaxID=648780 RepID=A0A2P8DZA0_9ACTN|nr:class E sortase [Haloactinopolyspora alba]PSL02531.1 sortase A [Haloactinopolyspora alba]